MSAVSFDKSCLLFFLRLYVVLTSQNGGKKLYKLYQLYSCSVVLTSQNGGKKLYKLYQLYITISRSL